MSVPPAFCPNCAAPWTPGATVCPNCGFVRPGAAWPPPPTTGFVAPPLPPQPRLVTGLAWADLILGMGVSVASLFVFCIGLAVMPILYFTLRTNYPVFARGIGYGALASLVLLLGACVWCFGGLANYHGG